MKIESNVSEVAHGVENKEALELQHGRQCNTNFLWAKFDLKNIFLSICCATRK